MKTIRHTAFKLAVASVAAAVALLPLAAQVFAGTSAGKASRSHAVVADIGGIESCSGAARLSGALPDSRSLAMQVGGKMLSDSRSLAMQVGGKMLSDSRSLAMSAGGNALSRQIGALLGNRDLTLIEGDGTDDDSYFDIDSYAGEAGAYGDDGLAGNGYDTSDSYGTGGSSSYAVSSGYEGHYVVDKAGLMTESEASALESAATALSEKYKANIVILTENRLGESSESALQRAGQNKEISVEYAYVAEYYDEVYGVNNSGVICYIDMGDRFVDLDSTGSIQKTFDYERLSDIRDDMTGYLSRGDYVRGFSVYLNGVEEGFESEGVIKRTFRIVSAFGAAVVSAIAVGISKSKLNTARKQAKADRYQKPGSMHVTRQADIFMYSTVNRVRRERESRSGGGGGGSFHSSGGGSHTSSGGHF